MITAARAGVFRGVDNTVRWLILMYSLLLGFLGTGLLRTSAAEPGAAPPSAIVQSALEYRETPGPLVNWSVSFTRQENPFAKEPPLGVRKVARGQLGLGGVGRENLGCIWDYREGKLYLDLNDNKDLTDDAAGVFATKVSRYSYYSQTFTNMHLRLKRGSLEIPVCVDLFLYNPEAMQFYGSASCRSLWQAKVELDGREWQVGRVDGDSATAGAVNGGYLVMRPWEERDKPLELQGGLLDGFAFPHRLFTGGKAYDLECRWMAADGGRYQIGFRPTNAVLAQLNLTGQSLHRVVMLPELSQTKTDFAVVLDNPSGTVSVPVGHYPRVFVELKAGDRLACRQGQASVEVRQDTNNPSVLTAGGPLTNSVTTGRQGRQLSLGYSLVGADGAEYMLTPQDRSKPPQFVISKNGKEIHSGKFEFG